MEIIMTFIHTFVEYLTNNAIVFLLVTAFGMLYQVSGAADAIAERIVERFGSKSVIRAIAIIGVLLSLGGLPGLIAMYFMYPLIISFFKESDIPKRLHPVVYFVGVCISWIWVPGNTKIGGLLPAAASGIGVRGWSMKGIILAVLETIVIVVSLNIYLNRIRMNGEHYKLSKSERETFSARMKMDYSYRPSWFVAILPVVVVVVAFKFTKLSLPSSLVAGILVACICFVKALFFAKAWIMALGSVLYGAFTLLCAAVISGIVAIMQLIPAYNSLSVLITNFVLKH